MENMIELVNVSKKFGDVTALDNANFICGYNEVVGLVGDNGAGKSTLIKIINGYHNPNEGKVYIFGKEVRNFSVNRARDFGIETVYQERALADLQTLWRNVFMGRELSRGAGILNINKMTAETTNLMRNFMGFTSKAFNYNSIVKTLSGGERQGIAIARALYFNAKLIILDEPTMSLSLTETEKVLDFIRMIKKEGKSCIFIDHNIYHLYPVVERIVVLDRGRIVGEIMKKDVSLDNLVGKLKHVAQTGRLENN